MKELKIFQLALEQLMNQVEELKEQLEHQKQEIQSLKERPQKEVFREKEKDEGLQLLDTKEVLQILGVCYNTFQKLVRQGWLTPIRIHRRRVKYSKSELLKFIQGSKKYAIST
ncbi:MAG: DNA-binding protein [Bacteroidetes bacterium]|nr:MAG: DNA-binding protein [Bacteroidota bacterium]